MTVPAEAAAAPAGSPREAPSLAGKLGFWLPWPPLLALDLWSKSWAFGRLAERQPELPESQRHELVFAHDWLRFDLVAWGNTGTIWGLGQDFTGVLIVLRCAAVVGLFWFVHQTPRADRVQLVVLSLILAGALGNLYDNLVRADRSVRDFLRFSAEWPLAWDFPAFNVADSCITVGAVALFLLLWRREPGAAPRPAGAG